MRILILGIVQEVTDPMPSTPIPCARCTTENHRASRFCSGCGLPIGAAEADAGAWVDVLGPYEDPDPADPDVSRQVRDFVTRVDSDSQPIGLNWRVDVLLPMGRKQAVFLGAVGLDAEGRPLVALASISGTANDRDPRILLKLNARTVAGHFAIKVLQGEEYFVVIHNLAAEHLAATDADRLVRYIAETADNLEDRLSRGRDLF